MLKKILELILCILHPVAVLLIWVTLPAKRGMSIGTKIVWAIASIIPFVPFLYVLTGHSFL